jgi:hypothetical protein
MQNTKELEKELNNLRIDTMWGLDDKDCNDATLLALIKEDYENCIDLRNRIKNGTDADTTLYEEDHLTLDHILDYMETFYKMIKILTEKENKQ